MSDGLKSVFSEPEPQCRNKKPAAKVPQEHPAEAEADPQPELQREPEPLRPEAAKRIAELESELKRRDDKIKELTTERDEAQELVDQMREHVEDANQLGENWIEGFDMHVNANGLYQVNDSYQKLFQTYEELLEDHDKLIREWNKFIPEYNAAVRPRERGRPLATSEAQQADVTKRRKNGQTLRAISRATGLGLRTVCTIVDKPQGRDTAPANAPI